MSESLKLHIIFSHYVEYFELTGHTLLKYTDEVTEAVHSQLRMFEERHQYKRNTGVWFETLFIIFINVFEIDIIYIIFIFWDIIHYFCQIQTLFILVRHYLSKFVQNWDKMG